MSCMGYSLEGSNPVTNLGQGMKALVPGGVVSQQDHPSNTVGHQGTEKIGDQRLEDDFRTTTNGRAGGLLARTGPLSGHPSKQQPRSTVLDLVILLYHFITVFMTFHGDVRKHSAEF
ncbi:hypothetical protein J6590_085976 [Homalodisca vitripennis]|nr:hypothetical protein J6590_085976 [Homalodisca vitripennis]